LEGVVRPRDIQSNNTVYSYNVADAAITYRKSGIVNRFVKPGTFKRWTTAILLLMGFAFAVSGEGL